MQYRTASNSLKLLSSLYMIDTVRAGGISIARFNRVYSGADAALTALTTASTAALTHTLNHGRCTSALDNYNHMRTAHLSVTDVIKVTALFN